ncbi:MAG: leucine-rich repeat protein, partial [Prevotella sp.]|nr:leucine-rich repeat protein [Prevotella sp.]
PTAIESYAFAYCNRGLTSYDIPETVTNIGTGAFKDCEKLPNIVIKPAVLSIGSYAFNGCTSLTGVTFEECEEALSLGYNEAGAGSAYLGKGMFFDCPLESVFIGRSLSYKTNMQYGYSPFANSATLQTATMGKGATTISANLFYGNHKLKTVTISETVISIGSSAFLNCDIISDLLLPNSLETIGDYAFSGCSLLSGLIFHPALKSIGNYAFRGCTNFTNFAFEESEEVLSLGNGASEGEKVGLFKDCPLVSVFIGRDLSYKYSPFANIATLTKARFGNPVTRIPNYVFQGVAALEKVEFNENCKLDAVGKYAFAQCSGLPTPAFPSTVTAFEEGAFQDCTSFSDFAMPAGLTTVGAYTFQNCTGFTKFTAPSTLTSIGNYAFAGCTGITSLVIEDSEEALSLGYGATKGAAYGLFFDCPLESLYLGKTLNYTVNSNGNYGYSPFYKISTLNEITIGPKVTSLPYCVFFGTGISEIYIPSNVTSMHSSALNNCNQLKRVIILGSTPISTDSNNSLITNSAEGSKFYVFFPDNYKSTKPWNNYADRIEPIGQFNTDFSYTGKSQTFTFSSDFPITLSNLETEVESGTYTKRIDVSYVTNGYTCNDILIYTYSVGKSIVTVTAKDVERVYGDENPAFEIVLDGFADGEDATTLESAPVAVTDATQMSKVGVYNIVVSGAKAKNYDFNYKNGTLTITKAPLTITAKDYTIKQGEELPTFEVEYDGFKNNEISSVLIKQPNISTTATSSSAPGEYEITVSGAEAQNYEITYVAGKLTIEEPDFIPGDANSDGNVNVTDIVEIVNYILGHPSAKFNKTAADVNNDGVVNVTDIVSVVNIILSSNARELTNRAAATNNLKLNGGSIKLRNAENYTAAQFDIHLTDGSTVNYLSLNSASDHQMTWKMVDVNTCRVIVYSLSNAPFRTTKDELFSVTLSGNATISNELLVNVDGMVTGINEMQFDKPVDVYDLRGNKVRSNTTDLNGLQKGVYIVNGKKVIVK